MSLSFSFFFIFIRQSMPDTTKNFNSDIKLRPINRSVVTLVLALLSQLMKYQRY